jgi:hypothetical protein
MSATPQPGNSTLKWVFLGLAFIVFLIIINSGINSCKRNNSESNNPKKTENSIPQPRVSPVKTSRYFEFDRARSVHVYLKAGWKDYPKGGEIKIETPEGRTLYDKPGVQNNFGMQPDGWYTISAMESKTTGVEIYNYW